MYILGLSAYYHDSSACLLKDGAIVSAAEEERFNREKHSSAFPIRAINYCLQTENIVINDIDFIVFYEKPYLKFSRVIKDHIRQFPFSLTNFLESMPRWLEDRLILPITLEKETGFTGNILFIDHHLSHAASAFLFSPFEKAIILTADSVGDRSTTTWGVGENNNIALKQEIRYPDSLGLLYSTITTFLGFKANGGEGKVMGLSGYGKPSFINDFEKLVEIKDDGSFRLNQRYFTFNKGKKMYGQKLIKLLGTPRVPESKLEERHYDIAASLQVFTENILIRLVKEFYKKTQIDNLCLAGGLFLNCIANNRLLEETQIKNLYVQPATGDSGGALGAAAYVYNSVLKNKRNFVMESAFWGPKYADKEIETILNNENISFKKLTEEKLIEEVAKKISMGKIIGWFQDRMEIGPRALGNRSILADPRNPDMKDILNKKVKHRESFRPFAPAVLEEFSKDYFIIKNNSPFMLIAARVREDKKHIIPAVTHVDGTARVQTVNKKNNKLFWDLINKFKEITGVPVIINTSFNLRGEPIVCTPLEALKCFNKTHMDCLVLNNYLIENKDEEKQ